MQPILILRHHIQKNNDYLTTWLENNNIKYQVVNAGEGQEFPNSIEPYSALAVMGGDMSVNDPLISNRQAEILILQAIHRDIPVIGHCLGGQLISKALGGTVVKSMQPEIGWQPIRYEANSLTNEWFGSDPTDTVIHWHYESFSIPSGATLLATSDSCVNQAFAYGKHLAMQFHIEINEARINSWVNDEDVKWLDAMKLYDSVQDRNTILAGVEPHLKKHQSTADKIYTNWLKTTVWAIKS